VPCPCLVTSAAAGLRSGRERKAHTPFALALADETPGKGTTLEARSGGSQPTAFVKATHAAPAPTTVRNRPRVNLVPIAQLYTTQVLAPRQPSQRPTQPSALELG